jgi:DNA-directed RNA polymerase
MFLAFNRWAQADPRPKAWSTIAEVLPPAPQRGDLDIDEVKKSLYFFK